MEVRNKKWGIEEFLERRRQILAGWPTGKEVDLDESVEYQKRLPEGKVFSKMLEKAKREGRFPVEVAGGHATVEETLGHKKLVEEGGADLMYINGDSYTKSCQFEAAQRGIEQSLKAQRSLLNGYPYVNHGVKGLRRIVEGTVSPLVINAVSYDEPMLCAEIGHAGGGTANGSVALRALLVHSKNYPLDRRIQNSQYTSRLAAYYTERGAPITVLIPSMIHGYIPSGIALAIGILQCLLNAEQGVTFINLDTPSQYNLSYDVAVLRVARELAEEYLHRFGYHDVRLFVMPWPWEGQWPRDLNRAAAVIAWHTTISVLGSADWIHVRSTHEGLGIPSPQANIASINIARQLVLMLANQRLPENEELLIEAEFLRLEVKAIVDRVIELGDGDVAVGELRAVEAGVLDVLMSPWIHVAGKVLPVRDRGGVLRWLDYGSLPLPKEVVDFHRQRIAEREKAEGRKAGIEMLIDDISSLSRTIGTQVASVKNRN